MSEITPFHNNIQYIPKDSENTSGNGVEPSTYWAVTETNINAQDYEINTKDVSPVVSADVYNSYTSGSGITRTPTLLVSGPVNVTANETLTATFLVSALVLNSDAIPEYQWQKKEFNTSTWSTISGATSSQYTIATLSFDSDNGDSYRCVVSATGVENSPVTSSEALLTVRRVLTITQQPTAQASYVNGTTATFSVAVTLSSGTGIQYQWQKREFESETFQNISGATSTSYTTPNLSTLIDSGDSYRCIVSHPDADTKISDTVRIIVTGADFEVTPAINNIAFWRLSVDGPLILDPSNAQQYTIKSLDPNRTKFLSKMWGQGSCSSTGGYTEAAFPVIQSQVFTVKLNAGAGSGTTPANESVYAAAGTYTWICPAGVNSVSVVCVGGGGRGGGSGGGGGGLGWKNSISVTPGQSYTVVVGAAGTTSSHGGDSYFINSSTVKGGGGRSGCLGDTSGGSYTGTGGGNGGNGSVQTSWGGGGGGAGGYSGNGGNADTLFGYSGSGGGGGGGSGHSNTDSNDGKRKGGGGGGVGLFGQGANGVGAPSTSYGGDGGGGGSGGANGDPSSVHNGGAGGLYGGGSGGANEFASAWIPGTFGGIPGGGAVRIVWGGNKAFPSTNVGTAQGSGSSSSGGGYAGLFNGTTVDQANALAIAGGAGGGGASTTNTCVYSGGSGGGLVGGDAFNIPGVGGGTSAIQTASVVNSNPACAGGPSYGWYTRTGGSSSSPTPGIGGTGDIRQLVIKWDGSVIYNGPSTIVTNGFVLVNDYRYYPSTYQGSVYGWCGDGTTCGTCGLGAGDFGNAFNIYRSPINSYDGGKGATQSSSGAGGSGFGESGTETFNTVGTSTINIPAGVSNITYEIVGGTGGTGGTGVKQGSTNQTYPGGSGARGQKIVGTLNPSQVAGQTLSLHIAGNGGNGSANYFGASGGAAGAGLNSGGTGGSTPVSDDDEHWGASGGGGGGSSSISIGTTRLLIAGGGGGGGGGMQIYIPELTGDINGSTSNQLTTTLNASNGGTGGTPSDAFNSAGGGGGGGAPGGVQGGGMRSGNSTTGGGGQGGNGYYSSTYVSGASVSTGTTNAYIKITYTTVVNDGINGSALQGGNGGVSTYGGGGGGGGYFGGGGGAGFYDRSTGGGGGSGFVAVSAVSGYTSTLANTSDPYRDGAGDVNSDSRLIIEQTNIIISQQPTSIIVQAGTNAVVSLAASIPQLPNETIQYQWQKKDYGTSTWNSITGANSSSYTILSASSSDNRDLYRCILSNPYSITILSNEADITVIQSSETVVYRTAGVANFTIPTGVEKIRFHIWGAGGEGTGECVSSSGGAGGYISGVIDVTSGDMFLAKVGSTSNGSDTGQAGFGAGRGGGWAGLFKYASGTAGGAQNLVAIAGGGGGAGQAGPGGGGNGNGSGGGGQPSGNGGNPGTQSFGGSGVAGGQNGSFYTSGGGSGFMNGGFGGGTATNVSRRGGGGGGGYYGGGGGGGGNNDCSGGGGGGGSGFVDTAYLGPSDTSIISAPGAGGAAGGANPGGIGTLWNDFVASAGGYQAGRSGQDGLIIFVLTYGYDFEISPAIAGKTNWSLIMDGPLILDGSNSTTYTLTALRTISRTVKMWGQGRSSGTGGYSYGNVSFTNGNTYSVRLNAGDGSAGSSSGWPSRENGGGYAGLFSGTSITQGNAIMMAGGAGGTGFGHGSSAGGHGGGLSGNSGASSSDSQIGSTGGGGGTQNSGGGGGSAGGSSGGALQGGSGGAGQTGGYPNAGGGGGGGGGYYGGGGGGGGNDFGQGTRNASGGGGGSGYINGSLVSSGETRLFANTVEGGVNDPNRGNAGGNGYSSRVVITT